MKTKLLASKPRFAGPVAWSISLLLGGLLTALGQGFDSGSTGTVDLDVTENMTVDLPPDGVLHYNKLTVRSGKFLTFNRNALNTPVTILVKDEVVMESNSFIDLLGGQAPGTPPIGGFGGPGGFDGGKPGIGAEVPPGAGYGPGAGGAGVQGSAADSAGGGSYGSASGSGNSTRHGAVYGSHLLIPIIGGSGGGGDAGQPGAGGGGGGGAILIAANNRILMNGNIRVHGGGWRGTSHNGGSGGAVRLVSTVVGGSGSIQAQGGGAGGGHGRIRIDTIDRRDLRLSFSDARFATVGANMFVSAPTAPKLDIIEAAGTVIPEGTAAGVHIQLPFGSTPERTVVVQARNWARTVPIRVVVTPDSGPAFSVDAEINNTTVNPATVSVPVTLPVNTLVTIHAWTR
jgi:hypothetical protein